MPSIACNYVSSIVMRIVCTYDNNNRGSGIDGGQVRLPRVVDKSCYLKRTKNKHTQKLALATSFCLNKINDDIKLSYKFSFQISSSIQLQ